MYFHRIVSYPVSSYHPYTLFCTYGWNATDTVIKWFMLFAQNVAPLPPDYLGCVGIKLCLQFRHATELELGRRTTVIKIPLDIKCAYNI